MNYNKFINPKHNGREINNRAKLDTGTFCNYKCEFCYYLDKLDKKTDFDIIKNRIDYLVKCGINEVDLSGGESSIHKDWFKILDYCTKNNLKISTLSNGSKFKDEEFLIKSKEHGLREILFSIHGNEEYHNNVVKNKNAYENIINAINNALKHNLIVRVNCTVTEKTPLDFTLELDKRIKQLNFLPINYWGVTKNGKNNFQEICNKIIPYIDNLKNYFDVNIRYIPFCYMKNHIEHIKDIYQHVYDLNDWNIALYDYQIDPEYYKTNKEEVMMKTVKNNLQYFYKPKECFKCKYFNICDGVKNNHQPVFPIMEE